MNVFYKILQNGCVLCVLVFLAHWLVCVLCVFLCYCPALKLMMFLLLSTKTVPRKIGIHLASLHAKTRWIPKTSVPSEVMCARVYHKNHYNLLNPIIFILFYECFCLYFKLRADDDYNTVVENAPKNLKQRPAVMSLHG